MKRVSGRTDALIALLGLSVGLGLGARSARADFERSVTLTADQLRLVNLIGEVRLEGHAGDAFEAVVTVRGDDAREDLIEIETKEGAHASLIIHFPTAKESRYVYPPMGRGSHSTFSASQMGKRDISLSFWDLLRGGRHDRITVSGSGRGLELWVDVLLRVPAGKQAEVYLGVGEIQARGVTGDLYLDGSSGAIAVENHKGELSVDTGSGGVSIDECQGREIRVDTGSGSVELCDISCQSLLVDTGSGGVRGRGISADGANIDTGSGSIALMLDRMGDGAFRLDTGSGSVTLVLPEEASADVRAETGSGSVRADVDFTRVYHRERDELAFVVGDGAATVDIDTGSGSIEITQR